MPGLGSFRAQGAIVKLFSFFETLEGEAFGGEASYGDKADTLAQTALETRPLLLVKFCSYAEGVLGALLFVCFERSEKLCTQRIVFWSKLFDPLLHHLSVAESAEASKEFACEFAHLWPGGVGVDFRHYGREGTTAANGNTEIVDGVGIGGGLQAGKLFENPIHPIREATVFRL